MNLPPVTGVSLGTVVVDGEETALLRRAEPPPGKTPGHGLVLFTADRCTYREWTRTKAWSDTWTVWLDGGRIGTVGRGRASYRDRGLWAFFFKADAAAFPDTARLDGKWVKLDALAATLAADFMASVEAGPMSAERADQLQAALDRIGTAMEEAVETPA